MPSLSKRQRALLIIGIIVLLAIAVALALTDHVGAATQAGNRGGCALSSQYQNVKCVVSQAGPGWAFGNCELSLFFMGQTRLKLASGARVSVDGCLDNTGTLYSAPGFPLRIRKR